MYITAIDMSFMEMMFYAVDAQTALYCCGTGCHLEYIPSIARTSTAVPWRDCPVYIGNDGYPSGFL